MSKIGRANNRLFWMLLIFLFCAFLFPSLAYADLQVQFTAQSTALFVNEEGTWEVEIHNPDGTDVTDAQLTITLPTGYGVTDTGGGDESAGPPHTLIWTNLTIPASSSIFRTHKASPNCDASSGSHMEAEVEYDLPSITVTENSLNITIRQLDVSFTVESTILSIGEQGTWTIRLHNPYGTAATNVQVVATIADGFRVSDTGGGSEAAGPSHTITWSGQTVPAGGNLDLTFKGIPECGANPGLKMSAWVNCSSNDIDSSSIAVKLPNLSITKTSGGSTQPTVHRGETITWDVEIKNGGNGDMLNGVDITDTLGDGFGFISLTDDGGNSVSWNSWNTGLIAAGGTKTYHLAVTVDSCGNLTNQIDGSWSDGANTCQNVSLTVSAALEKNSPDIDITVSPPGTVTYCGYPNNGNITTIRIENTGADAKGPANNLNLDVSGLPSDWGVGNITVTTGGAGSVTWDAVNERFVIGSITESGGARDTVEFAYSTGPTGSACPATSGANLIFSPTYQDECGVAGQPPIIGPVAFTVDASTRPSITVDKTGPRSANLSATGLSYDLTVTYNAPVSASSVTVDIEDDYPDNFTVTNAGGGTVAGDTITWSNVVLTPNISWTKTIVMNAPTDPCDADQDYTNPLTVSGSSLTDCLECSLTIGAGSQNTFINHPSGPIASSSKSVTYYNSMTGALDSGLTGGEVCTDNQYRTYYTFNTGTAAPAAWSDTDGSGNNIVFNDRVQFNQTFVSVDNVQVNGTPYPGWPTADFPNTPLDLGYLDGAGAPVPNSGAQVCVTFTLHATETSVTEEAVDFSGLTVHGYSSSCGGDDDYDQGVLVSFARSLAEIGTAGSPNNMDACETEQFRINLSGGNMWPLYDLFVELDTQNNYTLLGGVGDATYPILFHNVYDMNGNAVSAFDPQDNSGGTFSWDFPAHGDDIRSQANSDGTGATPYITFYMQKGCDNTAIGWRANAYYNTRCYDESSTGPYEGRYYQAGWTGGGMLLVRKAALDTTVEPATIIAYTQYPEFDIAIWNRGSGTAYNVEVLLGNDSDLVYWEHSIPQGATPDSVTGAQGDNDVTFHYDSIPAGEKRYLHIRNKLTGCTDTDITVTTSWGCGGSDCESIDKNTTVNLTTPTVIVVDHSVDHKMDYCGDNSRFTIKAKSAGNVSAYNLKVVEKLPPGFSYQGNETYDLSWGTLIGPPTITQSGNTSTGITITWDFSTVLPLDADGEPALPPDSYITINFDANITNCTDAGYYSSGDKKAAAHTEVDPPCNAETGGSISSSSDYNLYTDAAHPHVTTLKEGRNVTKVTGWTTGTVITDKNDVVEWRITLTSDGDYLATYVRLDDTIPTNTSYVAGLTTVDGAADPWTPTGILSLGDMAVGSSHVVIFRTMVNSCTSDTVNTATTTWGCLTGCGGTTPPTEQTSADSVGLRTIAYIANFTISTVAHPQTGVNYLVTDGGRMRVAITNYGSRATLLAGDYISIPLPKGFNYDSSCLPTISSNQAHGTLDANPTTTTNSTCGGANGELGWNNTKIDYIDTNETITLEFNIQADGCYLDTTCAGFGPDSEPTSIPSSTIQGELQYTDSCENARSKNSSNYYINPKQPDLDISVDPAAPVVQPGDTQKIFTFTIVNHGDEMAKNVAEVGGAINEPYVSQFGPGYQNPQVLTDSGGVVNIVGNEITVSNMNDLAPGSDYTVTVTLDISPDSPSADYWIDGEIKGTSLRCSGAATDATSQPCTEKTYSDDKVTAAAGEGKLVLRPNHTGTGKPCGEKIYIHTLRNNGQVADNFDLTATSSLGLSYLFYLVDGNGNITGAPITGIYLDSKGGANDKQSFAIRLFIPCDTPENSVDITKVTATFRSDPQASRTVTDITIVRQGKMRLVKEESVDGGTAWHTSVQAQQGDTVIFRLTFTNIGTETLSNIRVIDSIPDNTVYVTGSATSGNDGTYTVYYSTDGGASWNTIEPAAGDVTHIKWTYTDNSGNLASGESHYVTYEVDLK